MTRRIATLGIIATVLFNAAILRADAVSDWNTIMLNTTAAQNPFAKARFAAITQLAVFEAANACTHQYHPYLDTITAPYGASADAAAIAAAHHGLKFYFP